MWERIAQFTLVSQPTNLAPGNYHLLPSQTIEVSSGQVLFRATSQDAPARWWKAFRVRAIALEPSPTGASNIEVVNRNIPLRQDSICDLWGYADNYQLVLEFPWWMENITVEVWYQPLDLRALIVPVALDLGEGTVIDIGNGYTLDIAS